MDGNNAIGNHFLFEKKTTSKTFSSHCVMSLHMLRPTLGQDASMPKIFPKSIIHASLHLDIFWQRFAKDLQEIMQYDLCKYLLSDGIQTVILKEIFFTPSTWGRRGHPKTRKARISFFIQCTKMQLITLQKFNIHTCFSQFLWFFSYRC